MKRHFKVLQLLVLTVGGMLILPQSLFAEGCAYIQKQLENGQDSLELVSQKKACGILKDDDTLVLYPDQLKKLSFDENGLGQIYLSEQRVFYVLPDGTSARAFFYDNGPDYFVEGLARTIAKGKIGFMDKKLRTVIPARYDFATMFQDGLALVCNGCERVPDGEHYTISGGKWGAVNKKGEEIYPVRSSQQELDKRISGNNY